MWPFPHCSRSVITFFTPYGKGGKTGHHQVSLLPFYFFFKLEALAPVSFSMHTNIGIFLGSDHTNKLGQIMEFELTDSCIL